MNVELNSVTEKRVTENCKFVNVKISKDISVEMNWKWSEVKWSESEVTREFSRLRCVEKCEKRLFTNWVVLINGMMLGAVDREPRWARVTV